MPENTQDVRATGEQEDQGPPIPEILGGSGSESSTTSGFDAGELAKKIEGLEKKLSKLDMLDDIVDARVKSVKDKRVNSILSQMDKIDKVLQYAEKFGGDKDRVARELAIDELLESNGVSGGDLGRSPAQEQQVPKEQVLASAAEVLSKYGMTPSDPEVVQLALTKEYGSLRDYLSDLDSIGRSRVKGAKQSSVTPSAVSVEPSAAPMGDSAEELTDQLARELSKATVDWDAIDKLTNRLGQVSPPERL